MTFSDLQRPNFNGHKFVDDVELDEHFFYSVPTSFFVIDQRIPKNIRELITEAEGCSKMNYLTGASACTRKAIYELLLLQKCDGPNYDEKISSLRKKNPAIDAELFEILGHIKDMTSDHVHEESWVAWSSGDLHLFIETLKAVLYELYVLPDQKKQRTLTVRALKESLGKAKNKGS